MFGSGVEIDIVSAALTGIDEPVGWMLKIDILK
jgi:hypothetical protein